MDARLCVWGTAPDVDSFSDCTTLNTDSAICIDLEDGKWSFGGTIQLPMNVLISDKYLVTYLVVMGYPKTIIIAVVFVNMPLLFNLIASQSAINFISRSISWTKTNCVRETCSVVWCVLWIAQATEASSLPQGSTSSKTCCSKFLVQSIYSRT